MLLNSSFTVSTCMECCEPSQKALAPGPRTWHQSHNRNISRETCEHERNTRSHRKNAARIGIDDCNFLRERSHFFDWSFILMTGALFLWLELISDDVFTFPVHVSLHRCSELQSLYTLPSTGKSRFNSISIQKTTSELITWRTTTTQTKQSRVEDEAIASYWIYACNLRWAISRPARTSECRRSLCNASSFDLPNQIKSNRMKHNRIESNSSDW